MNGARSLSMRRGARQNQIADAYPLNQVGPNGIQAVVRWIGAVVRLPQPGNEGAKQAIPDDEDAAEVVVAIVHIAGVMNAVMRWGVQHPFQRSQATNPTRVQQELIEAVHRAQHDVHKQQRRRGWPGAGRTAKEKTPENQLRRSETVRLYSWLWWCTACVAHSAATRWLASDRRTSTGRSKAARAATERASLPSRGTGPGALGEAVKTTPCSALKATKAASRCPKIGW